MKIDAAKFGIAFGIIYALVFFVIGILAAVFGWGTAPGPAQIGGGGSAFQTSSPVLKRTADSPPGFSVITSELAK